MVSISGHTNAISIRGRLAILGLPFLLAVGCGGEEAGVKFRVDLVDGATEASAVTYIDDSSQEHSSVGPGEYIDAGSIAIGTTVKIAATNKGDTGTVCVHILVDDCFRASETCQGACTVDASYEVKIEECEN